MTKRSLAPALLLCFSRMPLRIKSNKYILNWILVSIFLTCVGPFAAAQAEVCQDLFEGFPGRVEVVPGSYGGKLSILYTETDASGEPIDRGFLAATINGSDVEVSRIWVDGGADLAGKPHGLRGNSEGLEIESLRRKGVSKKLFARLLEIAGPGKTVHADLAYTNAQVIWQELRRLLKLPEVRQVKSLNDAKFLINERSDPKSAHYVPGFSEKGIFKEAVGETPFMKAWVALGYSQYVDLTVSWVAAGSPDQVLPHVSVSIRQP